MIVDEDRVSYRWALEALRNGVPNRDAVRLLGCNQHEVERQFSDRLDALSDPSRKDTPVPGILVQGDFGTGKSHLLEYCEHLALINNFVCSRIAIGKETPLYNPEQVFRAAIENGIVPDLMGQMVDEIALKLRPDSPDYVQLFHWSNQPECGVSPLFPATLLLHERLNNDPELVQDIVRFWSGDKISMARVRQGLQLIGQASAYSLRAVPAKELATQRFAFALQLIRGAGYRGWVILIDELEVISAYSIMQRGRAYAELARWMGLAAGAEYPGLVVVGTIATDFAEAVLNGRHDRDYVVPRLQARGTDEFNLLAARAESGMRLIERERVLLAEPTDATLDNTYSKLKEIHGKVYNWSPPDLQSADPRDPSALRRMRTRIRRWINEWDLKRLYPDADIHIEEQRIQQTYSQDKDLEENSATESI